jgi:hypothetical protein
LAAEFSLGRRRLFILLDGFVYPHDLDSGIAAGLATSFILLPLFAFSLWYD